jgi:uncharacterized membrane protein YhhN
MILISLLALGFGAAHIYASWKEKRSYTYVFKPLTIIVLLLMAILRARGINPVYSGGIIAGIIFSLVGDVALMLPKKQIIIGMSAFLVAHIAYIVSFSWGMNMMTSFWPLFPILLYGAAIAWIIFPKAGKIRFPALVYEIAILAMAWRAVERMVQAGDTSAVLALSGAMLFLISDSLWACNFIIKRCTNAQSLILATYYLAQWLIVLSI